VPPQDFAPKTRANAADVRRVSSYQAPVAAGIDVIGANVERFSAEAVQADDITCLVVRRNLPALMIS
jgi:hypothetical protein